MRIWRHGLLLLLAVAWGSAQALESCALPSALPKPVLQGIDCKNTRTPDSYALAMSWSPQYCASVDPHSKKNALQCQLNQFGFVVHGLWGQNDRARGKCDHPRNCSASLVSADTIKKTLCVMPGVDLIQGEWQKHGTCTGMNEARYFEKTRELWSALNKPEITKLLDARGQTTAGAITKAFVDSNRGAGLFADAVVVQVTRGNQFSEVLVCYDTQFRFHACAKGGTPARQNVNVVSR